MYLCKRLCHRHVYIKIRTNKVEFLGASHTHSYPCTSLEGLISCILFLHSNVPGEAVQNGSVVNGEGKNGIAAG